jgi:hypothetical protein
MMKLAVYPPSYIIIILKSNNKVKIKGVESVVVKRAEIRISKLGARQ